MATYVVGDLQGCLEPLKCLLQQVSFDPASDQLWSTGDLVNRGPDSLGTLRFLHSLGDSFKMVLGNHDLHLLALYHGCRKPSPKDTLNEILEAPDADHLCHWLQQQPLLLQSNNVLMTHAGIPVIWPTQQAVALANEVAEILRGDNAQVYFDNMYGNLPAGWSDDLQGPTRWRTITNYFTRMRYCDAQGNLDLIEKGPLGSQPPHLKPWFDFYPADNKQILLFGHWAALEGQNPSQHLIALDTGCVWGGSLTLYHLENNQYYQCNC